MIKSKAKEKPNMKKRDFLRMIADRVEGDRITQTDINRMFKAMTITLNDILEYNIMKPDEFVKLQQTVRLVVKFKKAKVLRATKLQNIKTGEPILVEERIIPEKKMIVLDGFEIDL